MAVEITHVRYSGSYKAHETITAYKWTNHQDNTSGSSDKPTMVDWIDNKGGSAYVRGGGSQAAVGVVRPTSGQPYLRTYADGKWTDNLLALPTF